MKEINDKDAARLVSMIYRPDLKEDLDAASENIEKCTVKLLVEKIEENLKKEESSKDFGGKMTKEEYQEVINQIKSSDTLMNMEIVNFKDNESTNFRAMTLKDPTNQVKPVIVFRGTAGNYQWDDNLAAPLSPLTPSQQEVQEYMIQSGLDHLTLAGHSKGGFTAAAMAYLLPKGMVDKVYSLDGQGASNLFLSRIPYDKREYAKELIFNINEYRDIVSQLLNKTGSDGNTSYFNSGVDFKDTDFGFSHLDMYLLHPHKPNYFLTENVREAGRSFVPSRWVHGMSQLDLNILPKSRAIWTAKNISAFLYDKDDKGEKDETAWSYELWSAVYDAGKRYHKVDRERHKAVLAKLSQLYQVDFSKFDLVQDEGSFVVEGAVLTCQYCSGIGTLEHIEDHGHVIQNKAVASVKDNKPGENICINNAECSLLKYSSTPVDGGEHKCKPFIVHEWIITDSDKMVSVDGENVEAVLKKSALGCLNGGMIVVVDNGQMDSQDIVEKAPKKTAVKMGKEFADKVREISDPVKKAREVMDLTIDLDVMSLKLAESGAKAIGNRAKAIWNAITGKRSTEAVPFNGLAGEEFIKTGERLRDRYIDEIINQQICS